MTTPCPHCGATMQQTRIDGRCAACGKRLPDDLVSEDARKLRACLTLEDPRWETLSTCNGDGAWVPGWLRRLLASPNDASLFEEMCELCSQEVTYSAAFAAAPYIVRAASHAVRATLPMYLLRLGQFATYRIRNEADPMLNCPPDLEGPFLVAMDEAFKLAKALFPIVSNEDEVRQLLESLNATKSEREFGATLASLAAFKGYGDLARGIVDIVVDLPCDEILRDIDDIPF